MSMEYIRRTYKVPAKRGLRVRFESAITDFDCTIIGSRGMYLRVRSDTTGALYTLHPTWRVVYPSTKNKKK